MNIDFLTDEHNSHHDILNLVESYVCLYTHIHTCIHKQISWWMNKHNSHHAVPNLVESCENAADGDPDIDTMPFLAWSKQMFMQVGCVCVCVYLYLRMHMRTIHVYLFVILRY